ncbi:hypothetical protein HDZ31DRAFT_79748 [Schizophyllum fasciatum]
MDALRDELKEKFGEDLSANDALLEECVQLCTHHGLDADSFLWKWEAMKWEMGKDIRGKPPRFDADKLGAIRAGLHRKLAEEERQRSRARPAGAAAATRGIAGARAMPGMRAMTAGTSRPLPPFARQGRMAPVKAEPMDVDMPGPVAGSSTSTIVGTSSTARSAHLHFLGPDMSEDARKARTYRYMYTTINERSAALDERIDNFVDLVRAHYGISLRGIGDPAPMSEALTTVVGRIISDTDGAKLTEGTLRIETSRYFGRKGSTPLRFSDNFRVMGLGKRIEDASANGAGEEQSAPNPEAGVTKPLQIIPGAPIAFFPNAIVALRGRNGSGTTFVAEEALALPPLSPPAGSVDWASGSSVASIPTSSTAPFTLATYAGPYTADSDLSFAPWLGALTALREEAVDVVVLIGPFLDSMHPMIKAGDADEPLHRMFLRRFLVPLRKWLNGSPPTGASEAAGGEQGEGGGRPPRAAHPERAGRTEQPLDVPAGGADRIRGVRRGGCARRISVVTVAGLSDWTGIPQRIRFLPNPARFAINGVSFATTSAETVFHMQADRVLKRGAGSSDAVDPIANLYRVMLEQRSFYPIFPCPQPADVHLDVGHARGLTIGTMRPPVKLKDDGTTQANGKEDDSSNDSSAESRPWEQTAPDVLIVPTRLKEMTKRVTTVYTDPSTLVESRSYTTLAVNPSYVAKGRHAVLRVTPETTGEGRGSRPYVSRPSRTQQLENAKALAKKGGPSALKGLGAQPSVEVPEEFKRKEGTANKILEQREKERKERERKEAKERGKGEDRPAKRARRDRSTSSVSDSGSDSDSDSSSSRSSSSDSDSDSDSGSSVSSRSSRGRSRDRKRCR